MADCRYGFLSIYPPSPLTDSDLRWIFIRLDLSCSQGQSLEIGLFSDWIISPRGKDTREVKKKTMLSFSKAT